MIQNLKQKRSWISYQKKKKEKRKREFEYIKSQKNKKKIKRKRKKFYNCLLWGFIFWNHYIIFLLLILRATSLSKYIAK